MNVTVFDESWNKVENPDEAKGKIWSDSVEIECRYVVDQEERGHFETVREYPNGGKDVEWKVDTPEVSGWRYYRNGEEWSECPMAIPDDWPHENVVKTIVGVGRWREYTAEELEAIAKKNAEAEKKLQEAKDKAGMIDALPDAVADLSEQVSNNTTSNADLADALADLSMVVSNLAGAK